MSVSHVRNDHLSSNHLTTPFFVEAHSGTSLFDVFFMAFGVLYPTRMTMIVGSSTDGAPKKRGCSMNISAQPTNATGDRKFIECGA